MTNATLLGHLGRALYPPRNLQPLPSRRVVPTGGGGGLFSKQSLVILMLGIMFGYLLLPVLLVQHLGFDDVAIKP